MTETTKSHDTRRRVIAQAQAFRFWAMRRPLAALGVLLGAGLLGWLGAGLVTGHYLRQTRPGKG